MVEKAPWARAQASGMTISVSAVDTAAPNRSEIAMPWKIGSVMIDAEPPIKASDVMTIGRVLARHDWITASCTGVPARMACLEKSTSRMEFLTMMPARAIQPIMLVAVNSAPSSQCPGMMPISVSGIGAMMMPGRRKLPNSSTTSM